MSQATNPVTDLTALHTAALTDLAAIFPKTPASPGAPSWDVRWYGRITGKIPTPAIYLELTDMEELTDRGTNQWNARLKFEAYVFTDYTKLLYQILCRVYAAQLAAFLHNHKWTGIVGTGMVEVLGAYADKFAPTGGDQYDCMRVEFVQSVTLGVDTWAGGNPITEVFLGFAPNIGPAHRADYIEVIGS